VMYATATASCMLSCVRAHQADAHVHLLWLHQLLALALARRSMQLASLHCMTPVCSLSSLLAADIIKLQSPTEPLLGNRINLTLKLLSCAAAAALKESSSIQMPAEGMLQLMTLQLVLLLLSTCHLVVIMAEDLLDPQLMQLLLAADMLAKSLTDAWPLPVQHQASGAGAFQRMADVLLVQCNMCPQKMQPAALQELHSQVNKQLAGTAYLRQAGSYISCCSRFKGDSMHAAASSNGAAGAVQQDAAATSSPTSEPGVHLWVLPQEAGQHSDKAAASAGMRGWGRSSWHQQLVGKLLSWPRRMVWRGVSERDWAKGAERAYEQVRGSRDVIDFHIMAQRALYSNGGGWRL
jgi:hypothetical protein